MSQLARTLAVPAAAIVLLTAAARVDGDLRGYTAESSKIERTWEATFRAMPEPARMREAMRRLTLRPHHVGSPYDRDNAEWLREQFKSYGWDATIEEFQVLFPIPTERVLEMVAPRRVRSRRFRLPAGRWSRPGIGPAEAARGQRVDVDAGPVAFGLLRFASTRDGAHRAAAGDHVLIRAHPVYKREL